MMKLFMRNETQESIKKLDKGLDDYFATARRLRSQARTGTIVLVDKGDDLFKFFTFLIEEAGLPTGVVHVDESGCGKKAIEDIGATDVKAVIIDDGMVGESLNGDSLIQWLSDNHPAIPIWIVNCEKKKEKWIRSQTRRIGVIPKNAPLEFMIEAVGLSRGEKCQAALKEYTS